MSAQAQNLEAIAKAIDQHNDRCEYPAIAVLMNPFEIDRLGWDEVKGLPIVGEPKIGTGRFRVVCSHEKPDSPTLTEARGRQLQKVA